MPSSQFVDPTKIRKKGMLKFKDIPLNQYDKTIKDEKGNFTKEEFLRIYRDMLYIREFEDLVYSVRIYKKYKEIDFEYTGQGHLYTGQEAQAVGQAFILGKDDYIFGTHRSHGENISKSLSCIQKLSDKELMDIMGSTFNGSVLRNVEDVQKNKNNVKELAIDFLFYGLLSELFGRETGFAKGLGGSMHAFFTPFGVYPNNAIVGASAPIALGAAMYKKINRKKGICIANIGDGSLGCGPVWESLNMAAMDQFTKLWEEGYNGGLPLIFNFINNSYGMGGQTSGETMAYSILARVGAGISPDQMHAERIDGLNPLAVIDAMKRKKQLIEENKGPVLLDVTTYRYGGHSTSDPGPYRTKEELETWKKLDSIQTFKDELIAEKIASEEEFQAIHEEVANVLLRTFKIAKDEELSPRISLVKKPGEIEKFMFSNQRIEKMDDRPCEVLMTKEENPRMIKIRNKERFAIKNGKPVSKIKQFSIRDALFEAILDKFYVDPTLISYGEDVREWGGAFAVYQGLTEALPYHRMFNSPISESTIISSAVGYAMCGGRSIVELMYCDFVGRAGDELFNQLAKWQGMTAGVLKMPVVVRISVGYKAGAQHSQDWSALPAHIPGLKVVFPVTPYDAKGMMNTALMGTDPVIFLESQKLYDKGEFFHEEGVPEGYYEIPLGEPDIKREGKDITILSVGAVLYEAIEAAKVLDEKYGISAEVIDARSIVPFNYEKVLKSVRKTGKIVVVGDACERGSFMDTFARNIQEMVFDDLDAPVVVLGSRNWITPIYELGDEFFPQPDWIIDAIHEKMMPIKDHITKRNFTKNEQIRRARLGV
jgi:2-oxoisovalerate dehydrogenase E1 component